jgi:hypothetical protein
MSSVKQSYSVVEQSGGHVFGIDGAEVMSRRRYVQQVRRELQVRSRRSLQSIELLERNALQGSLIANEWDKLRTCARK